MTFSRSPKPALAAVFLFAALAPAMAADRWEAAGSGAVAILPNPTTANGIASGSLFCAEQKWGFLFRLSAASLGEAKHPAKITINSKLYELEAVATGASASVAVPSETLPALKAGTKLAVEIGPVETGVAAVFNLRGSKLAIEAVAPKCSQIDMSKYELIALSETDAAIEQAKIVVADEMKIFRQSTGKEPVVSAAMRELADQRRLLFAAVCGSTNYYGPSGCNLTGYAATGATGAWQQVYNTQGMILHLDPDVSNGGWPNLVTLPVVNGMEPTHWVWSGEKYELRDVVIAGDQPEQEEGDKAE